jgi:hypothetical protein
MVDDVNSAAWFPHVIHPSRQKNTDCATHTRSRQQQQTRTHDNDTVNANINNNTCNSCNTEEGSNTTNANNKNNREQQPEVTPALICPKTSQWCIQAGIS